MCLDTREVSQGKGKRDLLYIFKMSIQTSLKKKKIFTVWRLEEFNKYHLSCQAGSRLGRQKQWIEIINGNPLQYSCWENPMDRGAC